jgi:hypothetical protein
MLAIALGTNPAAGMLIRGYARYNAASYTTSISGSTLYMSTSDGLFTATAPTASGNVVRIIGHNIDNTSTIYFNPDQTWVELISISE